RACHSGFSLDESNAAPFDIPLQSVIIHRGCHPRYSTICNKLDLVYRMRANIHEDSSACLFLIEEPVWATIVIIVEMTHLLNHNKLAHHTASNNLSCLDILGIVML